jgi:hypothetical protein
MPPGELLADRTNLLDYRVSRHGTSSPSSSGVQITGGANPAARHALRQRSGPLR